MARPVRIEYAGAVYHITTRGNAGDAIFFDDADRRYFLELLHTVCERYGWLCHAYCLMDNHYHLLIETQNATLSKGMKYLNGTYTQYVNREYARGGHVFQGRFKGILVERDSYLLELCRYIVLNPVRVKMVRAAKDWPWSSYRATAGIADAIPGLTTGWVLGNFGRIKKRAIERYRDFVKQGKHQPSPLSQLKHQIYLGSDQFIEYAQSQLRLNQSLGDTPKSQKLSPPKPLLHYKASFPEREGMARAYLSGHYTLSQVGEMYNKSYATVSRAVKAFEQSKK